MQIPFFILSFWDPFPLPLVLFTPGVCHISLLKFYGFKDLFPDPVAVAVWQGSHFFLS